MGAIGVVLRLVFIMCRTFSLHSVRECKHPPIKHKSITTSKVNSIDRTNNSLYSWFSKPVSPYPEIVSFLCNSEQHPMDSWKSTQWSMLVSLYVIGTFFYLISDVESLETYYYSSQPLNFSNWNHNFSQNFQTYWAHLHQQQLALQQPYNDKLQQSHYTNATTVRPTHEPSATSERPVVSVEPVTSSKRPVVSHKPTTTSKPVISSQLPLLSHKPTTTSTERPKPNDEQTTPSSQGPYVEQAGLMRPPLHEESDISQPDR